MPTTNQKLTLDLLRQANAIKPTKNEKFRLTEDAPPNVVEAHRLWKDGFLEVSKHYDILDDGSLHFFVSGLTRAGRQLLEELEKR